GALGPRWPCPRGRAAGGLSQTEGTAMNRSRYSVCAAVLAAVVAAVGARGSAQAAPDPIEATCRSLGGADPAAAGLAKLLGCEGAGRRVLEDEASSALGSAGAVFECLGAGQ